MSATLWLTVIREPHRAAYQSVLWRVTRPFLHLPSVAERVVLWPDESDDPLAGPQWPIRHRFWDAAGQAHLELVKMVVDPNEAHVDQMTTAGFTEISHGRPPYEQPWATRYDGDPESKLKPAGWMTRNG